jgi:hypothetical protein
MAHLGLRRMGNIAKHFAQAKRAAGETPAADGGKRGGGAARA